MYTTSIALTIIANILYHFCQKEIRPDASPLISLIATYGVGLLICLAVYPFMPATQATPTLFISQLTQLNWASYALGAAIVLLELGFLLAYRAGWNIGVAALLQRRRRPHPTSHRLSLL